MGVDYSAFAVFGQRVELPKGVDSDDVQLPKDLELYEYGSRCYGGTGGFILGAKRSYAEVDIGHGGTTCTPLADVNAGSMTLARDSIKRALESTGLKAEGEPSWFVGGHIW